LCHCHARANRHSRADQVRARGRIAHFATNPYAHRDINRTGNADPDAHADSDSQAN
jgi:hypothetical protein